MKTRQLFISPTTHTSLPSKARRSPRPAAPPGARSRPPSNRTSGFGFTRASPLWSSSQPHEARGRTRLGVASARPGIQTTRAPAATSGSPVRVGRHAPFEQVALQAELAVRAQRTRSPGRRVRTSSGPRRRHDRMSACRRAGPARRPAATGASVRQRHAARHRQRRRERSGRRTARGRCQDGRNGRPPRGRRAAAGGARRTPGPRQVEQPLDVDGASRPRARPRSSSARRRASRATAGGASRRTSRASDGSASPPVAGRGHAAPRRAASTSASSASRPRRAGERRARRAG